MIAHATKDDLAEVARILALQAAHYARKYGEMQLPDLTHLLTATSLDDDGVGLGRPSRFIATKQSLVVSWSRISTQQHQTRRRCS